MPKRFRGPRAIFNAANERDAFQELLVKHADKLDIWDKVGLRDAIVELDEFISRKMDAQKEERTRLASLPQEPSESLTDSCKCLACTYGPPEPVTAPTSEHAPDAMSPVRPTRSNKNGSTERNPEHVPDAMSPSKQSPGCKSVDNAPSKDANADPRPVTSNKDQPPRDITADLSQQVATVKEKIQTKHRRRPPDDEAAEPEPQPQDRPPDLSEEGARIEDQMPSYAWHLEEEGRCWGRVLHTLAIVAWHQQCYATASYVSARQPIN